MSSTEAARRARLPTVRATGSRFVKAHVLGSAHTVSAATWKKLTPQQQAIFREESASAGDLMRKLIADDEADQIRKLEAAGMQVTRPDLAPFRARMDAAYKRIADYAGEANVKKFRDMVERGRSS